MNFDQWINSLEKDRSVLEKAQDELVYKRYTDNHSFWQSVLIWLKLAYNIGYSAGKREALKKELV